MVKPRYLVGITGRRNLDKPEDVRRALASALAELRDHIDQRGGRLELYGSIARGTDTLAAQEARKLDIPVHLILPKPVLHDAETGAVDRHAGFAADFRDEDSTQAGHFRQQDWDAASAEIEKAARGENGGSLRLTPGSQSHPECYYDANLHLLESIDVLLAVLDDKPDRGLGGSKAVVALAGKKGLPLIIVQTADGTVERERLEQLVRHDDGRKLISRLATFSDAPEPDGMPEEDRLDSFLHRLARHAKRDAEKFRNSIVRALICTGMATAIGGAAAILPQKHPYWMGAIAVLAIVELGLVSWALWQTFWLTRKGGTHDRWLASRFALEISRQIRDSAGLLDPLHPLIAKYQPHWKRFALTVGLLLHHRQPPRPWSEARDAYVRDRLRHPDPKIGQIAYFTNQFSKAEPRFRRTIYWGQFFGTAAVGLTLVGAVFKVGFCAGKFTDLLSHTSGAPDEGLTTWIVNIVFRFLPIAVPMLAGLFLALRTALDSGRRTYRYNEIAERLTLSAVTLASLETESAVRRAVAYTEDVLVDELVEWHLTEEQNGAR